jgi:kumamolisin
MASRSSHVPIEGTEYVGLPGAIALGPSDPNEEITVTVVVSHRGPVPELHADTSLADRLPRDRKHLSREDFETHHGAHPDAIGRVESFAQNHGFEIVETSVARHSVVLRGKVGDFSRVFRVKMIQYDHERGQHRGNSGTVHIPRELVGYVQYVLGLHNRPSARRHLPATGVTAARHTILSARDFADFYRFPRHATGKGQCIGIIELGGGYHKSDVESFCSSLKIPVPKITDICLLGAKNAPVDHASLAKFVASLTAGQSSAKKGSAASRRESELAMCTTETTMDIELVAGLAPGADIVVYFVPNSEQGIYAALTTALADKHHRPSVLSLSWGEPEPNLSPKYAKLINDVLKNLANVGVTVCVSSGDLGAHNGLPGGPSVNFPASSPYALGCGGTTLKLAGRKLETEIVWNSVFGGMRGASGGGVSRLFSQPYWQQGFEVPHSSSKTGGRGVPDVAAVADPETGCHIVVGGVDTVSSGTSAAAPLWAAFVARLNHATGAHSGYLNSLFYKLASRDKEAGVFRHITHGENGVYHAGIGWNACTGLGSPLGDRLLGALDGKNAI